MGYCSIQNTYMKKVQAFGSVMMKNLKNEQFGDNLEEILLPVVSIASFNAKAAYLCGQLRADLEKQGIPLDLAALEIAAIALANVTFSFLHCISISAWI